MNLKDVEKSERERERRKSEERFVEAGACNYSGVRYVCVLVSFFIKNVISLRLLKTVF